MSWFFFFNDTATTEIYTLSLHDALPISTPDAGTSSTATDSASVVASMPATRPASRSRTGVDTATSGRAGMTERSEEHTSELQSRQYLVCRLLLEKKQKNITRDCFSISYL